MAQLSCLEIVNEVERNIGLSASSTLSTLSGFRYKIWQWLNEELLQLSINNQWKQLEESGTITLVTDTQTYAKPSSMVYVDKFSFIYNETTKVMYRSTQEIDAKYKDQDKDGTPLDIYEYQSNFVIPKNPTSAIAGNTIKYRYWKLPTALDINVDSATTWIPEGFDRSVLIALVSARALQYRHNDEYREYRANVYSTTGSLASMKRIHGSPSSNRMRVSANL